MEQAFLFRPLQENVILSGGGEDEKGPTTAKLQNWRKIDLLEKLHNILIYIKASLERI